MTSSKHAHDFRPWWDSRFDESAPQPLLSTPAYPRPDVRRPDLRDQDLVSETDLPQLDPGCLPDSIDWHGVGAEAEVRAEIRETLTAWARGKAAIEATRGEWSQSVRRDQLYAAQRELLRSLSHEARELMATSIYLRVDDHTFVCVVGEDGEVEVDTLSVLSL